MELNTRKLQNLMDSNIVKSVICSDGTQQNPSYHKMTTNEIESMSPSDFHTIGIQLGYNHSKLRPMFMTCSITDHITNLQYYITVPYQNLSETLDMLNWDNTFPVNDTAQLFNQLMLSSNNIERDKYSGDLKSSSTLFQHINYNNKKQPTFYSISGTEINNNAKFETIEQVYDTVRQNYIKTLSKNNNVM